MAYHRPVLLNESIEGLNIKPKGVYVDLTFGGGGHSRKILEKLSSKGQLFAFDQDPDAEQNLDKDKRLVFIRANFRYLKNFLRYYEIDGVDGILADLGISSHQIDKPERGFTFRSDSTLDMRMNPGIKNSALEILNEYSGDDLLRIFREYGEIERSGSVVKAIVQGRERGRINSSGDLEALLENLVPKHSRSKFLARLYQAIRIEVNDEMTALKEMLPQTGSSLLPGGRLVIITYHSLEDRLVKNYMKSGNVEGKVEKDFYGNTESPWKLVNRKIITPGEEELKVNNRARSAKLRIAEKI